jgi:hypothetical protein
MLVSANIPEATARAMIDAKIKAMGAMSPVKPGVSGTPPQAGKPSATDANIIAAGGFSMTGTGNNGTVA